MARAVVLEEQLGLSAGALRTSISRLRRVLGGDALGSGSAGYELLATVDAVEYERFIGEAFQADAERARRCLDQAAALWQGPAYEEFAQEPWAEIEVRRLHELRAAATEELAVLLLDAGEHALAITTVLPLIEEEPFRDRPRALLLRAFATAGRRTDALREFQQYRTLLQTEIGTEPSAPVVALDRAIAAGTDLDDLRAHGHPAWTRRRGSLPAVVTSNRPSIPTPLSSFVGRASEMAELGALVRVHRVVTITGSGGSGKSRLAMRVAATALERDGADAWWVDLGVLSPNANVAEQIATEIGVLPGPNVITELERRLRGRRSLLVLDNAEHVVDGTSDVLTALLTRCPDARALITSRQPLGLAGEVVWRVPELSMPDEGSPLTLDNYDGYDALRLFMERARAARPGMVLDRHAVGRIAAICRELDGMPLAIELAAARLRSIPLATVAEGISEVIGWNAGDRSKPARHATLRASIEWSVGLIDEAEQRALVSLAVFRSPFDVDAADAVMRAVLDQAAGAVPTSDHLGRLADVGLLQFDDRKGRYRMLATVRHYCTELGQTSGDLARAEAAHAAHMAQWCQAVGEGRFGIERHRFVRRMPDVVAASAWARRHDDRATMYAICRSLAAVRSAMGQHADFEETWAWLLAIDPAEREPSWAEAVAALLATATSQVFETGPAVTAITALLGDGSGRAAAWLQRGVAMVPAYRGRPAAIHAYAEELLERGEDLEASVYAGFAAYMQALLGRLDCTEPLLDGLRHLTRRHGCTFSVDSVGNGYAAAIIADTISGDLPAAMERGRRRPPTDPGFSITSAAALAHVALLAGDHATMRRALEWGNRGSFPLLGFLTPFIGCCAALLRDDEETAADLALETVERVTVPVWHLVALPVLNSALLAAGRPDDAARLTLAAAPLLEGMDVAPQPRVAFDIARAQVAVANDGTGERGEGLQPALTALGAAYADGRSLSVVDALDLLAVAHAHRGVSGASRIAAVAASERSRLGYRFSVVPRGAVPVPVEGDDHGGVAAMVAELLGRSAQG